jgi:hypothetical protein
MRVLLSLAGNAALGILAGYGIADAASVYGLTTPLCTCIGFVGGCCAGLAAVL